MCPILLDMNVRLKEQSAGQGEQLLFQAAHRISWRIFSGKTRDHLTLIEQESSLELQMVLPEKKKPDRQ